MKYLVLIYAAEADYATMTPTDFGTMMAGYQALNTEAAKRGYLVGGSSLKSVSSATTLRVREGKVVLTDGPFAETKEQLGGYYIFDCPSLDKALELAAMIPDASRGSIEIRPLGENGA